MQEVRGSIPLGSTNSSVNSTRWFRLFHQRNRLCNRRNVSEATVRRSMNERTHRGANLPFDAATQLPVSEHRDRLRSTRRIVEICCDELLPTSLSVLVEAAREGRGQGRQTSRFDFHTIGIPRSTIDRLDLHCMIPGR